MKAVLCLIVVCLISCHVYSQNLQGVFKYKSRSFDEEYYFDVNGKFSWYRQNGETMISGDGTYKIDGDSLTLSFERAHPRFEIQANQTQPDPDGKSSIHVSAMYTDGKPVNSIKVLLKNYGAWAISDAQGKIDLILLDAPMEDELLLEVSGEKIYSTPVKLRGQNLLYALVFETQDQYKENVTEKLRFVAKKRSMIITDGTGRRKFKAARLKHYYPHQ
jgi:hypothetical protein